MASKAKQELQLNEQTPTSALGQSHRAISEPQRPPPPDFLQLEAVREPHFCNSQLEAWDLQLALSFRYCDVPRYRALQAVGPVAVKNGVARMPFARAYVCAASLHGDCATQQKSICRLGISRLLSALGGARGCFLLPDLLRHFNLGQCDVCIRMPSSLR